MLNIRETIPEGLLECEAPQLHRILEGPTLIHLPGRQPEPLFVSVLLHGNEITGWDTMRGLLRDYRGKTLPRALSLFIGNVHAARQGVRHLEDQPDFNRVWRGDGEGPEYVMVRQILEQMRERGVFASIDIHNNTGRNPHYACVNRLSAPYFHLATLFSRTVVYFLQPDTVQSRAFSRLCPAVTVECGKPGDRFGVAHAREFVDAALHLNHMPQHPIATRDIDLFHTIATVKLNDGISVGIDDDSADVSFIPGLDQLNFRELEPNTTLARVNNAHTRPFLAWTEDGDEIAERYFHVQGDELRTRLPMMPSMLTLDLDIMRQDCVCYLMERLDIKTLQAQAMDAVTQ